MARFLANALGWLDGVYDFVGSKVRTDDVDLGPVQLVHDVGRESWYGQGYELPLNGTDPGSGVATTGGSRFDLGFVATFPSATGGNQEDFDLAAAISSAKPDFSVRRYDVFCLGASLIPGGNGVNGILTYQFVTLGKYGRGIATGSMFHEELLASAYDDSNTSIDGVQNWYHGVGRRDYDYFSRASELAPWTRLQLDGDFPDIFRWSYFATTTTSIPNTRFVGHFYMVPRGTLPPGAPGWL